MFSNQSYHFLKSIILVFILIVSWWGLIEEIKSKCVQTGEEMSYTLFTALKVFFLNLKSLNSELSHLKGPLKPAEAVACQVTASSTPPHNCFSRAN